MNNKILIVEDSKVFSQRVKDILEKENYQCSQAFSFAEAEKYLSNDVFDLIVLDLHLPDGEGDELIKNIKNLSETKVVVMTVDSERQLREQLFQMGILDYIHKDNNIEQSLHELIRIIKRIKKGIFGHVLVVDDSKFICKQITSLLSPRNYNVDSVNCGKDALEQIKTKQYDLVILDFEMPDMNGDEVLKKIKKNKDYIKTPVVMLSGSEDQDRIRKVLKSGAYDYIKKPFFIEEFILKVDFFIDNAKKDLMIKSQKNKLDMFVKTLQVKVDNEVKKNEQQQLMLFSQSRHAQMGEMISMIAHQWRQPLNVLSLVNQLLVEKFNKGSLDEAEMNKFQTRSKNQIEYMSKTIDIFRDFFSLQKEKEIFYMEEVIDEVNYMLEPLFENCKVELYIENQIAEIELFGYSNELKQALLNVLNNAKDALIQKEIEVKKIKLLVKNEGDCVVLEVSDNAGGIDENIIDKIFDPYFSTKLKQNGTGLGLYMTRVIIEDKFSGNIKVSNIGDGATFKMIIPLKDDKTND